MRPDGADEVSQGPEATGRSVQLAPLPAMDGWQETGTHSLAEDG